MQPFMTLYRRGNSEELIDRVTDRVQRHRCMLHKGDTEAFMRDRVSAATNFPRFEASGNSLCCHGDPMQTRWFYMQFLAGAID
jgi:hypothetical protein